jgi:type I restriction enzyme S subunit
MPNLNTGILQRVSFCAPPKAEQQKIAKVLSTLDAKIELNNRINAELEGMAKLLYDYWFVQFDFPCLPDDYPSSGAGKPTPSRQEGKFCLPSNYPSPGAGKPTPSKQEGKIAKIAAACNYRSVGGLPIPQKGKYFVYVLLCADDSFYIGMTDDLYRRWFEHKTGQGAKWTKAQTPIKVIHHEVFDSRSAAAEREKELKTGFGRKWLKREYAKLCSVRKEGGLPAHQSKLMQAGKMVFNPTLKREIPEGWEAGTAASLFHFNPTESLKGNEAMHFDMACLRTSGFMTNAPFLKKTGGGPKFRNGDVVVARITPCLENGKTGLIRRLKDDEIGFGSTELIVMRGRHKPISAFGVCMARSEYFRKFAILNMTGTSGRKRIEAPILETISIPVPFEDLLSKFEATLAPMLQKMTTNEVQNQELTELRDWLLPMLMNGQVSVEKVSPLL